jgi:hypothetical protein
MSVRPQHRLFLPTSHDFIVDSWRNAYAAEHCFQVIAIIIRPVDWSNAPFATVQALPRETKPVARWEDGDEAWTDIARGLRRAAEGLRKRWLPS